MHAAAEDLHPHPGSPRPSCTLLPHGKDRSEGGYEHARVDAVGLTCKEATLITAEIGPQTGLHQV